MKSRPIVASLSHIVRLALPVVALPIVTRLLDASGVATYLVLIQLAMICSVVAELGSSVYLYHDLAEPFDDSAILGTFYADLGGRLTTYLLISPLLFLMIDYFVTSYLDVCLVVVGGWLFGSGVSILRRYATSIKRIVVADCAAVAAYVGAFAAVARSGASASSLFAVLVLAMAVTQAIQIVPDLRSPMHRRSRRLAVIDLLRARSGHLLVRACTVALAQSSVPILAALFGLYAAAMIGVGERLFAIIANVALVVTSGAAPLVALQARHSPGQALRSWTMLCLAIMLGYALTCLAMIYRTDDFSAGLFGNGFAQAGRYIPLLAMIHGLVLLNLLLVQGWLAPIGLAQRIAWMMPVSLLVGGGLIAWGRDIGPDIVLIARLAAEALILLAACAVSARSMARAMSGQPPGRSNGASPPAPTDNH